MSTKPGYQDFYEARGRQAMWLTAKVAYRIGACLAVPASRIGLSPNMVSVLSLVVALGGACAAVALGYGTWSGAAILFVTGHLAYGLDCADGVLARVTGRGSSFGVILDKAMDTLVGIAVPILLASGAWGELEAESTAGYWMFGALAVMTAARMGLAVSMWLREAVEKRERTTEDARKRTLTFHAKQLVGNVVLDDVSFRTCLALVWGLGYFWDLVSVLAVLLTLMLVVYLRSAQREMG